MNLFCTLFNNGIHYLFWSNWCFLNSDILKARDLILCDLDFCGLWYFHTGKKILTILSMPLVIWYTSNRSRSASNVPLKKIQVLFRVRMFFIDNMAQKKTNSGVSIHFLLKRAVVFETEFVGQLKSNSVSWLILWWMLCANSLKYLNIKRVSLLFYKLNLDY